MEIKRKISAALMLTCFFAMALNAFVVLTCDCVSCHTHTAHTCMCEDCALLEGNMSFTQHCECTHTHENRAGTGLTVENERVLKLLKIIVAELPRTLADSNDIISVATHDALMCPLAVPLEDDPLLGSVGLRAPPVFA